MPDQPERRTTRLSTRAGRIAGGTGGAALAIVIAWGYQEHTGRIMTPEVAAAIGGLISTCVICLNDIKALILAALNRRKS